MLKKSILLLICIFMITSLTACGSEGQNEAVHEKENEITHNDSDSEPSDSAKDTNILVVVFSATGNTRNVAEKISTLTGADLIEITPAVPYSEADLKYSNSDSRATKEQNDPGIRPEIKNEISLDGYKTVYLGYPIWWGKAPRILCTFIESHDFTGITVIPFCTSGSSDIGNSDDELAKLAGNGDWLQGKRFSSGVTKDELEDWINELGVDNMNETLHLFINDIEVSVDWENNESVKALTDLVTENPLTVEMSMYGGFEQVGSLGTSLPRNDIQTTTVSGDIMLYSGNQIVVFYGSNSWSYTRLGKITDKNPSELTEMLSQGDVRITISFA